MTGNAENISSLGQDITVASMDEEGKRIRRSRINFAPIQQQVEGVEDVESRYPLLSGIDPYGDTYFNYRQRPRLVKELRTLQREIDLEKLDNDIDRLVGFLRRTSPYKLIRFIGD